jgi:hypothetical protein
MNEKGHESLDAYVDALIRDDQKMHPDKAWLRRELEKGVASGNTGVLTPEKLNRLIAEGIARVKREA